MSREKKDIRELRQQPIDKWAARDEQIRTSIQEGSRHALTIPLEQLDPEMDHTWVRDTCLDDPSFSRMSEMWERGWEPVPESRYRKNVDSRYERKSRIGRDDMHYKGLILCERPKRYGYEEEENRTRAAFETINKIPYSDNGDSYAHSKANAFKTDVVQTHKTFKR